jgi:hypothetical protein
VIWSDGPARGPVHVGRMATEAEEVDVVDLEQARIGGTVWRVAGEAALVSLHRSVFEDERPHGVSVALGADRELTRRGTHLMTHLCPVRIMTIAALYQPAIDAMAIRPGELGSLCGVASEAQISLGFYQQKIDILGPVGAMAGSATDAIGEVLGLGKVLRLQAGLVTLGADRRRLRRTQGLKANDLGDVAAAVNMSLPRTMTSLTSMLVAL